MTLVYPTNAEYVSVLKNAPHKRFADPRLQRLQFEKKGISLAVMTGGLAIVFKATDPVTSKRYALRCFKGEASERHKRYSEISSFLKARKALLPFIVDFEFFPEELRVKTADGLPVVLMQWVDGKLLKQWLQDRCNDSDKSRILRLAEKWRQLIATMRSHDFAHGDLQHGNILINDRDEFILIDYDGMAVPNLHGPDSPELGLPGYQHRERTSGKFNKLCTDLDNFSAINIYLCLRVLAIEPSLIDRFGDHDEGLLFHPKDLESPDRSGKFNELKALCDPQFSNWIDKFKAIALGSLSRVPPLDQFLSDPKRIIKALDAADWDEVVRLAHEADFTALSATLISRIDLAREAVECRRVLKLAIDSGDEHRIVDAWNESVFSNYPAARDLAEYGRKAKQVIPVLQELTKLLRNQDGQKAVAFWDKSSDLLTGRASARDFANQIVNWRKRLQLAEKSQQLLKRAATVLLPELVLIAEQLEALGGCPNLSTAPDFIMAVSRNRGAIQLAALPTDLSAECDLQWINAWDRALFANFAPVANLEQRYKEAVQRRATYDTIMPLISATTAKSVQEEAKLIRLANDLPVGYCPNLDRRKITAGKRVQAIERAAEACKSNVFVSESAFAAILAHVREVAAESLLSSTECERLLLAEQRVPVLHQLALIPSESTFENDSRVLSLWTDGTLLRNCNDALPFRARYDAALERKRLFAELRAAKDKGDDLRIRDISEHPLLQRFKLDQQTQQFIKQAKDAVGSADMMLEELRCNREDGFARKLDVDLLTRFWPLFSDHHEKIREWMLKGVLKPGYIGLAPPALGQAIQRSGPTVKIKWQFPSRVTGNCIVTLSTGAVQSIAEMNSQKMLLRQEVSFKTFEQGGSAFVLPVGRFAGTSVSICAVVELRGERFYSAPLSLGKIPSG